MTTTEARDAALRKVIKNSYARLLLLCEIEEKTGIQPIDFDRQLDLFNDVKAKGEMRGWNISEVLNS